MEEIKVGDLVRRKTGGYQWHVDDIKQNSKNVTVAVCSREGSPVEEIPITALTKDNPSPAQSVRIYV